MNGITEFLKPFAEYLGGISFDTLFLIDACCLGGIYVLALVCCAFSKKVRQAEKRPFFHLLNAFSAVTLALFCTKYPAAQSIAAAAIFWCIGYVLYGLLCVVSKRPERAVERVVARPVPVALSEPAVKSLVPVTAPAAQSVVRLDHALSIADKLLLKTLGRGDRQEIEKIKTALTVLKVKGELTPQDGDTLNDMFNALLKLMAKYDL